MVATILFDIGATLMEGPQEVPARRLAAVLAREEEPQYQEIRRLLFGSPYRDVDELAWLICEALQLPLASVRPHLLELWKKQTEEGRPAPGAAETLRSFRDAGWRVGFVSNIWLPYFEAFRSCFPEAGDSEMGFFLSFREGIEKPAAALYERALRWTGEEPGSVIMVGDSYTDDIEPAKSLGLGTVWVMSRPEKERRSLVDVLCGAKAAPDWTVESIDRLRPDLLAERDGDDARR
jgi:FMN phosphatase YigB (HAD superfamily)